MFIDDEESLREISKTFLEKFGYKVSLFENGADAFSEFEKDPHQFDLAITDMTMPGITGYELAMKFLKIRPDFPILLCTGYSENISESKAIQAGIRKFIRKPIANIALSQIIREAMDGKD